MSNISDNLKKEIDRLVKKNIKKDKDILETGFDIFSTNKIGGSKIDVGDNPFNTTDVRVKQSHRNSSPYATGYGYGTTQGSCHESEEKLIDYDETNLNSHEIVNKDNSNDKYHTNKLLLDDSNVLTKEELIKIISDGKR